MNTEIYGSGTPIIFIHGAGGATSVWLFQKIYFERTNRVMLVDLPGHGKSAGDSRDSIEAYSEAVRNVLEEHNAGPVHLAGHSMGGAIAMHLAITYPVLFKSLVLIGTGAKLKVHPEILEGIKKDKEKTARAIIETAYSSSAPAILKERSLGEYIKNDTQTVFNDFTACDRFDFMGSLGGISLPTLIICGNEDRFTPPKYSGYLAENIPGSVLALIKGAGHMVMIENPSEVNEAIESFITSLG